MNIPDDLRFPGQPDHPDFWKLSERILAFDSDPDAALERATFDIESLQYLALQRAMRVFGVATVADLFDPMKTDLVARGAALYLEAMLLGMELR